jgi:signal transduction histidine kinase
MVMRAIVRVTPQTEACGILVDFDTTLRVGPIHTDAHRVEQILINLLGNATRHAPAGSAIKVHLLGDHSRVRIEVVDEGPGVDEEDLDRIFDIYQTKGSDGGVGLGLPLSRRLARLLGGDLRAEARAGVGGCFILELPGSGKLKTPS